MTVENQKRLLALLLGLVTIAARLFSWRAGQIGSTAAFDDRQSIGQTISRSSRTSRSHFSGQSTRCHTCGTWPTTRRLRRWTTTPGGSSARGRWISPRFGVHRRTICGVVRRSVQARAVCSAHLLCSETCSNRGLRLVRSICLSISTRCAPRCRPTSGRRGGWTRPVRAGGGGPPRPHALTLAVFVLVVAGAALTVAQVAVRPRSRYGFTAVGIVLAFSTAVVTVATVF